MSDFQVHTEPAVAEVFQNYPESVKPKLQKLRKMILEVAEETEGIKGLVETLKWGEPSYLNKKGSTLRMDWKERSPEQYALYFSCTTRLVPSFKTVFGDVFSYEKNRAIVFRLEEDLPIPELKKCIRATLLYHKVKDLPYLGLDE